MNKPSKTYLRHKAAIDAGNACSFMVPVYTVHDVEGRCFSYAVGSWQSGVPLRIVN